MVAAIVHRGGLALQRAQRVGQHRGAGHRAGEMRDPGQLAVQGPAPGGQPAGGLLRVLVQHGHCPGSGAQHRVVETGDLLGAEQHPLRPQRHRAERGHGHRVVDPVQRGRDDHDSAGELPGHPPEIGVVDRRHERRIRARLRLTNANTTPAAAHTDPPYRYHAPAAVLVTITLPPAVGSVSATETSSQPTAGTSAPAAEPMPAAPSTQVTRISAARMRAATGMGPALWLNWKQPISPCAAPNRNSSAYAPPVTKAWLSRCGRGCGKLSTECRLYA